MGKKVKVGKSRQDVFYHKAKEVGYRARASFKLLQINEKFHFLEKSKILIDLCAAPGSWLQVATKFMPKASIKIGVDLDPIDPIPGCKTFVSDITTSECKQLIKNEIHTAKADVVLHDGAPNVGTNWNIDEFQQAHLCLKAFTLATEFLSKDGTFVTKVFRSKDFESLRWVLKQLFQKVYAMKPKASRSQSAEIFLVCLKYKAPKYLDPKFLDVKFVFADVNDDERELTFEYIQKLSKKAVGYDNKIYKEINATELIAHTKPMNLLLTSNKVIFDDPKYENHITTTEEIKRMCKDLKLCNKHDFKRLKNWAKKLKSENEEENKMDFDKYELEEDKVDSENEDEKLLQKIELEIQQAEKKVRKGERKKKMNQLKQIQYKMLHPGDRIEQVDDEGLFSLSKSYGDDIINGNIDFDTNFDEMDAILAKDEQIKRTKEGIKRNSKPKTVEYEKGDITYDYGIEESEDDEEESDDEEEIEELVDFDEKEESDIEDEEQEKPKRRKRLEFMSKSEFISRLCDKNSNSDSSEDEMKDVEDVSLKPKSRKRRHSKISDNSEEEADDDESRFDIPTRFYYHMKHRATEHERNCIMNVLRNGDSEKREELLNWAYGKQMHDDAGTQLPAWFIEEEKKSNRRIPEELLKLDHDEGLKERKKKVRVKNKVDKTQSKKVLQAVARKKYHLSKKLKRITSKNVTLNDVVERRDYLKDLEKKVNKAKNPKKRVNISVSNKGGFRCQVKGNKGGKGAKTIVVDKRMKKDLRNKKAKH